MDVRDLQFTMHRIHGHDMKAYRAHMKGGDTDCLDLSVWISHGGPVMDFPRAWRFIHGLKMGSLMMLGKGVSAGTRPLTIQYACAKTTISLPSLPCDSFYTVECDLE